MERTLIVIKPDGMKRGLIGEIIRVFEENHLNLERLKVEMLSREKAEQFYSVHKGKDFYEDLLEFITSGKIGAIILSGENAVERTRVIVGDTDPSRAESGTIRRKFGLTTRRNTIHASDSPESFKKEVKVIFDDYQL